MARFKYALVDSDIPLFTATTSNQEEMDFGEHGVLLHTNVQKVIEHFQRLVQEQVDFVDAEEVVLAYTHSENWRKLENPAYKSNRKGNRRPLGFKQVVEWCNENYRTIQYPKLEADDVLGILAGKYGEDSIILSGDKDLRTIPGWHYDSRRDDEPVYISVGEADYRCYLQGFAGDRVDGFAGCPGVGDKTAAKLLTRFLDGGVFDRRKAWRVIVANYQKKGLTEGDAIRNARMARITRLGDWDFGEEKMTWLPL